MDLAFHLLFLATLAHFLLYPPLWDIYSDLRKNWLIFYSVTQLNRAQIFHLAPYVSLLLSFMRIPFNAALPSPIPPVLYRIPHFVFVFLFLRMHLPRPPSPVFLLSQALRTSAALAHTMRRFCLPSIPFYLPGIALSVWLLLLSLRDPYFILLTSPLETRETFLGLLFLEIILLAFTCTVHATGDHGPEIEQHARDALVHAVVRYVGMPFPPPLNVLRGLLACLPPLAIKRGLLVPFPVFLPERSNEMRQTVERVTWRIFVGPFALVASVLLYFVP